VELDRPELKVKSYWYIP